MNFDVLISLMTNAIKHLPGAIGDVKKWKMSVNGKKSGPISRAVVGSVGLEFEFTHLGTDFKLAGRPGEDNRADVFLNDELVEEAHLVFSTRSQPLAGKPLIVVFEFVNVKLGDVVSRVRFDCPK